MHHHKLLLINHYNINSTAFSYYNYLQLYSFKLGIYSKSFRLSVKSSI